VKVSKSTPTTKIKMKTGSGSDKKGVFRWWEAKSESQEAAQLLSTGAFIKQDQNWRVRQLAVDIRLYCGLSVYSYAGSNVSKLDQTKTLPDDRPTFNLIQSATDTLVSRLGQSRPAPVFLTDNSDYKERHIAQQLNGFILGEFYQAKAYDKAVDILRDGIVMGTGALKVYEDDDQKVALDRVLIIDLYTDMNDAINGEPQQLYQFKLVDRNRFIARHPDYEKEINAAPNAYPDNSPGNGETTADQVMVVEGWKLPSFKGAKDGRHCMAIAGSITPVLTEPYEKMKFPFVWFIYSKPFLGFFGQGLATQLFGTQLTLNRILYTIARAITLVGVPRVFQEMGSKVMTASNNNEIGVIVKYSGVKPSYEVAPCNAPELYAERDKLIQYGYQQCGVSAMQATSQMPEGLESGEAIRSYDNISTDRMNSLARKYDQIFIDLAYAITDKAIDIAKRDGKYQTVYPNKDGTKEIDLPNIKYLQDPFTIQCFSESSLPKDPAGRMQKITEMVQSGMISLKEGRRLLNYPDLGQMEKLANASEERIFQYLDLIVEKAKYNPPDPFMDLGLAEELTVQYYNLYVAAKLEAKKEKMLRTFFTQIQALKQAAMPPPIPTQNPAAPNTPQAQPAPLPQSPLVSNQAAPAAA
jgi:hypothetical protein